MFETNKFEDLLKCAGWRPSQNAAQELDRLLRELKNGGKSARDTNYTNIMAAYWSLSNKQVFIYRDAITYLEFHHPAFSMSSHNAPAGRVYVEDKDLLFSSKSHSIDPPVMALLSAVQWVKLAANQAAIMVRPPNPDFIRQPGSRSKEPRVDMRKAVTKWFGEEEFTAAARKGILEINELLLSPSVSITFYDATTEINKLMRDMVRDQMPLPAELTNIVMDFYVDDVSYERYFIDMVRDQMRLPANVFNVVLQYMSDSMVCPPYFVSPKDYASKRAIRIGIEKSFIKLTSRDRQQAVFCAVAQVVLGLRLGYFANTRQAQRAPKSAQKCASNWTGFAFDLVQNYNTWRSKSEKPESCVIL